MGEVSSTTKFRAQGQEALFLFLAELVQTGFQNPRGVRRKRGSIRENVLSIGAEGVAAAVLLGPDAELCSEVAVPKCGFSAGRGHDDEVSIGLPFDPQVRVLGTKLREFALVHRTLGADTDGGSRLDVWEQHLHNL